MELNKEDESPKTSTETKEKHSCCRINKDMIRFKAHYFLQNGGLGCILPYIPVVASNRLGFSATTIAAVFTAQQLISILSKPAIGYIADYFNRLKLIIGILTVLQTIFYFLILAIPPIKSPSGAPSSVMPNLFPEYFKECDMKTEIILLTTSPIQYCQNHSLKYDNSRSLFVSEGHKDFVEDPIDGFVCTTQLNETALDCFMKNTEEENINDIMQIYINCSSITSLSDIHPGSFQQSIAYKRFYLSSLETSLLLEVPNETYRCTVSKHDFKQFQTNDFSEINDFNTVEYWMFFIAYNIAAICTNSLYTLADTACFESVEKFGSDFGRQLLYGGVGWGSLALISGLLTDFTNDYISAFILMSVLQALTVWNIYELDLVKPHFSQNILKDVGKVLKSLEFLTFDFGVLVNGIMAGFLNYYLVLFLTSLGASKFLCGFTMYVQCYAGEIPFMFFSGWMIKKLGHFNLISLALVSYGIRFLWYSYLHDPWLVLPVEVLHGFTVGTFHPTVASFGKISAKPGTEATTQSILFSTHEGLGAGIGCILAGVGFDYFGGHWTFFYLSIFCFGTTLINIMNTLLNNKRHSKAVQKTTKSPDD